MYFNHKYGIDKERFIDNEKLRNFYEILTLSNDKDGKEYVSSIEARNYPFYAV